MSDEEQNTSDLNPHGANQAMLGQTINPGGVAIDQPQNPEAASNAPVENNQNTAQANENDNTQTEEAKLQRHELQNVRGKSHVDIAPAELPVGDEIVWEASEYIHHQKTTGWFAVLGITTIIMATIMYFAVDIWGAGVIILMAVTVIVYAQRKPGVLQYILNSEGLKIGDKSYHFDQFRSFNILHDGGIESIELVPLKRFMPAISIYFDPNHKDRIIDILSLQLPHEDKEPDLIDRFARQIRF